jgi:SAM-dependent methyltransferase
MTRHAVNYNSIVSELEKFYNNVGVKYELIYPNFKRNNATLAKSIIDEFNLDQSASIADMGCGCGWLLNEIGLLNQNFNLFGFDISENNINEAKRRANSLSLNAHYEKEDWLRLKTEKYKDFFDLIICNGNTITHFPIGIQHKIIDFFNSLIKKDGLLIVDCYKKWNNRLNNKLVFEPKGLTQNGSKQIVSCFFSLYNDDVARRNICFSHYDSTTNKNSPVSVEQYVTFQFPIFINKSFQPSSYGYSSFDKIELNDELGLFEYFILKK